MCSPLRSTRTRGGCSSRCRRSTTGSRPCSRSRARLLPFSCPHWLPVQPTLRIRVRAVHRRAPRVAPDPGRPPRSLPPAGRREALPLGRYTSPATRGSQLSETATDTIMELRHVTKHFPVQHGVFSRTKSRVHAVEDVSLTVRRGETLGIVGESGCGKSTTARLMLRLIDPTGGTIRFDGRDITGTSTRGLRPLDREMQMIFQDPYASLNPRKTVEQMAPTVRDPWWPAQARSEAARA